MHRKIIEDIVEQSNPHTMKKLGCIFTEMLDELKLTDYEKYKQLEFKMYCMVYGKHLTEDVAKNWVKSMVNKDGTKGEHWTITQTSQYAGKHDVNDWYAAMNMVYSDYYNPKFDNNVYVELANDYLNDNDVSEGKLLKYYMLVVR